MRSADLLTDAFGRVRELVHGAVDGVSLEGLHTRLDDEANSIAWLLWHLTRVQDDHIAEVAGLEQVWTAQDWSGRFGLPFPTGSIGFGHSGEDVAAVRVASADLLTGYQDAVYEQTVGYLRELDDAALDEVVDESWDPPVTLGVRLVSVVGDTTQHAGQASFVRGIVLRR